MRTLCFALMAALLLGLTACSKKNTEEDTSQYKTLIVGTWNGEEGDLANAEVTVAADGTVSVTMDDGEVLTGTYQLDGATLTVDLKDRAGEEHHRKVNITILNDQEMVAKEGEGDAEQTHRFTKKS